MEFNSIDITQVPEIVSDYTQAKSINKFKKDLEILNINKQDLISQNIHFIFNEEEMVLEALFIGAGGTPYAHGAYTFRIHLPETYPNDPPEFVNTFNKYRSKKDTVFRYHPNFYNSGKVCLSIINTWSSPEWKRDLNIYTVLMSMITLFDSEPYFFEPGFSELLNSKDNSDRFNRIILYQNIQERILYLLENPCELNEDFYAILRDHFLENYQDIIDMANKFSSFETNFIEKCNLYYNTNAVYNHQKLMKNIKEVYNKLKIKEENKSQEENKFKKDVIETQYVDVISANMNSKINSEMNSNSDIEINPDEKINLITPMVTTNSIQNNKELNKSNGMNLKLFDETESSIKHIINDKESNVSTLITTHSGKKHELPPVIREIKYKNYSLYFKSAKFALSCVLLINISSCLFPLNDFNNSIFTNFIINFFLFFISVIALEKYLL